MPKTCVNCVTKPNLRSSGLSDPILKCYVCDTYYGIKFSNIFNPLNDDIEDYISNI